MTLYMPQYTIVKEARTVFICIQISVIVVPNIFIYLANVCNTSY